MPNEPHVHPVYGSINRPLTIWGAERRLFLLGLVLGAGVFNLFGSLVSGLLTFATFYAGARYVSSTDPQILRILLNSSRVRRRYDPLTFHPIPVQRSRDAQAQPHL